MQHRETLFCGYRVKADPSRDGVAWARGVWPFKWIVLGRWWFWLTPGEQNAVLMHEVGHCDRFHFEKRLLALPLCWLPAVRRWAREHEHEADACAVREGHGYALLRFLRRYPGACDDTMFHPPPEERQQRILRLMAQEKDHVRLAA